MEICGTVVGTTASDSGGLVPKSPYPDLRAFRCFRQELQLNVAVVPEIKPLFPFFSKRFHFILHRYFDKILFNCLWRR